MFSTNRQSFHNHSFEIKYSHLYHTKTVQQLISAHLGENSGKQSMNDEDPQKLRTIEQVVAQSALP